MAFRAVVIAFLFLGPSVAVLFGGDFPVSGVARLAAYFGPFVHVSYLPLIQNAYAPPITVSWTTRASMPTARDSLGVVATNNGKIEAIGGHIFSGLDNYLSTVEEYDSIADVWSTRASMPTKRGSIA